MSEYQGACPFWTHFTGAQVERLRHCINENKYFLSQKAGHDVGLYVAEADFIVNHAGRVAAEFRLEFCRSLCAGRHACRIAAMVDDLNRFWAEVDNGRRLQRLGATPGLAETRIMAVVLPETSSARPASMSDPGQTAQH